MIPLRLAGVPTMMLLAICLLLGLAAAAPLPGVAWSNIAVVEFMKTAALFPKKVCSVVTSAAASSSFSI